MAARPTTSSEWMIHPSLVFKSFEDSLIKPSFPQFSQSSHIVPEKISESFVDPSGLRCYRVKWFDSWLTEQHISATFPHLITEYWINKPIDSEYQNYATNSSRSNQVQQNIQTPIQTIAVTNTSIVDQSNGDIQGDIAGKSIVHNDNTKTNKDQVTQVLPDLNNVQGGTGMSVPQLFSSDGNKITNQQATLQTQQQQPQSHHQQQANDVALLDKANTDFVVESLQLPERVGMKEVQELSKEDQKDNEKQLASLLPKPGDNSSVFLLGKTSMYNLNIDEKDKMKQANANFQKVTPVSVFNQLQHYGQQHIQFSQTEPMNNHAQQIQALEIARSIAEKSMELIVEKKSPRKVSSVKKDGKDKQPVACDICGKMISSRKNLRVHKTVRHFKNGSFACNICGRKFALNRDLQRHMPLHTNERKYKCQYCGLQCKQPGHLTKHLRTHTEVLNWRCDCCFKNFKVQAELKEHCFTEHADIKDKNLTCSVCKERLKLPNSVYLHSLRHSGVREHECEVCKATFKLKQHLQVHMKTHEKPKESEKIACPICEKVFKVRHMFDKHFKKHTETTAQEYKENKRLLAEEKKQRKRSDLKRKQTENSSASTSEDDDSDSSERVPAKRKQRKPTKVLYDEDMNTKLVVRRKFNQKEEHACTQCNDTFRSLALLKSHLKLHRQNEANSLNDSTEMDKANETNQIPMLFSMNNSENSDNGLSNLIDQLGDSALNPQQPVITSPNNKIPLGSGNIPPSLHEGPLSGETEPVQIVFLKTGGMETNVPS